ncbi:transglycosylase SLT domain-containing protein [Modestobacter sp. VKM Ac-2979]|uniref:aggregation-promoting factor C-terminal-like domain-containing protein n=1 Tax=unclassified Modestobacter TaxID=2643866 RepID=UPI0022AB7C1E|nr:MULTISPECIES: transglycosylase SLT domain-containing protein [unclassified Modestobacter]MCZ2814086.1 transglycosylase SLT domain-containing protein [Modestobacter sp. VKM Ac-2979]MCZ2844498.1 transglycosylase SLT domain-containing protein [Modestobacter sp. VKM Ac-2980]
MSRRTTASSSDEQLPTTEVLPLLSTGDAPTARQTRRRQPPGGLGRPTLYLSVAAAGAILVNVLVGGEPDARAEAAVEPAGVAAQLDLSSQQTATALVDGRLTDRLGQLAANRSQREAEQVAAAQAQAAADQAVLDAQAAEAARLAAEAQAAEEARIAAEAQAAAEAEAAEEAAAAQRAAARAPAPAAPAPARAPAAPAASSGSGSFQDYALGKLGGDQAEFSCLESLWGKESGWNPNAQNPTSTAYGIPQFLDSTWKSTGIAKTSDGYRQIDAGLIYINNRYGSPCGAWSHSKATGWY